MEKGFYYAFPQVSDLGAQCTARRARQCLTHDLQRSRIHVHGISFCTGSRSAWTFALKNLRVGSNLM